RNPVVSALAVLLVLTVVAGFAAVLWQLKRVRNYAGQVEKEKETAVRNEARAIVNRDTSNAYFRMASDAVHEFLLTELGQEQFEVGPVERWGKVKRGTDQTRRALLQKAETIYEQLLALESDPEAGSGVDSTAWNQARRTLATVLDNLAIYLEADDPKGAEERRQRALRLREQRIAAPPGVPGFRHRLGARHPKL